MRKNGEIAVPSKYRFTGSEEVEIKPLMETFTWQLVLWLLVFGCVSAVLLIVGPKAKNPNDQNWMCLLIGIQAVVATLFIQTIGATFKAGSWLVRAGRIVATYILFIVFSGLSFCTYFMGSGWLGG